MKTKHIQYQTEGTCSQLIDVTADEHDVIQLVKGQKIDDVIHRLDGIRCGSKGTSCPDQLSKALKLLKESPAQ